MRGNRSRSMTKTDSSSSVNCHHSPPLYRSESSAALRSTLAVSKSSWSFRVRGFVSLVMGLMPRTMQNNRARATAIARFGAAALLKDCAIEARTVTFRLFWYEVVGVADQHGHHRKQQTVQKP